MEKKGRGRFFLRKKKFTIKERLPVRGKFFVDACSVVQKRGRGNRTAFGGCSTPSPFSGEPGRVEKFKAKKTKPEAPVADSSTDFESIQLIVISIHTAMGKVGLRVRGRKMWQWQQSSRLRQTVTTQKRETNKQTGPDLLRSCWLGLADQAKKCGVSRKEESTTFFLGACAAPVNEQVRLVKNLVTNMSNKQINALSYEHTQGVPFPTLAQSHVRQQVDSKKKNEGQPRLHERFAGRFSLARVRGRHKG